MSNPNPSDHSPEERTESAETNQNQSAEAVEENAPAASPAENEQAEVPVELSAATAPPAAAETAPPAGRPAAPSMPALPAEPTGDEPAEAPMDQPAPGDEESFADLLSAFEQQHSPDAVPGQKLEGSIISFSGEMAFVDVGLKREGMLPLAEFKNESGELTITPGDPVSVTVTGRGQDGYYKLSTVKVAVPKDWSGLEAALAEKSVISGTVKDVIKGGLSVDIGARAFMPASRSGTRDAEEMAALVGQEIRCKVIQLDTAKEDVVVDRRVVIEEELNAAREKVFSALNVGDVVKGKVRSLTDFGAFIDIGGIDGLLHVTDLAWTRVNKPADLLSEGEEVEVKILKVDPKSRRISLGRKQLIPDPWTAAAEKYKVGEKVSGKVVRLTDFGAFVQLEAGVDGLIHISEMSWSKKIKKPSDVVKKGETVEVVILSVNPADKRIALGLKQALGDPWEDVDTKFPVGSTVAGKITNLAKFGAFVELSEHIEGMIHIADITHEKRLNHPSEELSEGQEVKAQVLEIDRKRKRIRLGMKQLQPTSADEYIGEHKVGDVVTGRFVDVRKNNAKVELGEGVTATCRFKKPEETSSAKKDESKPDLGALTAMLSAKWKEGSAAPAGGGSETFRPGQVCSFRISALIPEQKKIEVELAD